MGHMIPFRIRLQPRNVYDVVLSLWVQFDRIFVRLKNLNSEQGREGTYNWIKKVHKNGTKQEDRPMFHKKFMRFGRTLFTHFNAKPEKKTLYEFLHRKTTHPSSSSQT